MAASNAALLCFGFLFFSVLALVLIPGIRKTYYLSWRARCFSLLVFQDLSFSSLGVSLVAAPPGGHNTDATFLFPLLLPSSSPEVAVIIYSL